MAAVLLFLCSAFVVWVCNLTPVASANVKSCPASCTCLATYARCTRAGLIDVPKDIPPWITSLKLNENAIKTVRAQDFKGLHKLEHLDLSRNDLKTIDCRAFEELESLRTLKLDHNQLESIPVFDVPLNLTSLSMNSNYVNIIQMSALQSMPALEKLDLSNNHILIIVNGTFPSQCKLTNLNLNNNRIVSIHQGSFLNASRLENLKLSKNKLSELPRRVFKGLIHLKSLELRKNRLQSIRGLTFDGLRELQKLKLRANNISHMEAAAFYNLSKIKHLQLDNNSIANISVNWLYGLTSLRSLTLSFNKITLVEADAWKECVHLEKLNLTHNNLEMISEQTLAKLSSLTLLHLDHNKIWRIDEGAFKDLTRLRVLELNYNKISGSLEEDVSGVFRGLSALHKLGLKANRIRFVAVPAFSGLPKLGTLDLDDNSITSIQENAFGTLRKLTTLRFNSSNLNCDCELSWLPQWLRQNGFQQTATGKCNYPLMLQDASMYEIRQDNFKCNKKEFVKPVILESPKSTHGFKSENLTLTCVCAVTGGNQPVIQWKKDKLVMKAAETRLLASSDGKVDRFTSSLHLTQLQDTDAGSYQCIVSNQFGKAFSHTAFIKIYVYPTFLKVPKDMTVQAGKSTVLKCSASGHPEPVISWRKDGGEKTFPAARERRMHLWPNDDHFYIAQTKSADAGVYSCQAKSDAGTIVANATITVVEAPHFVEPMSGKKSTRLGETTVLQCMASGSPRPMLTWMKDDVQLVMTPRHFFTVDSQLLVIVDTQYKDAGTYACHMSNSMGKAKGITDLQVLSADGELREGGGSSFGLDHESTTTGIIIIAVVCCVVGTSLVWVIIIYHTRKRHEMYSPTQTDETTLAGESPSSGYMSSDKEGSYSQGTGPLSSYHYQDYQMKESGYESSSGQFKANPGSTHAYVDEADDDDTCRVVTAGDRLLRQINSGRSNASLQYDPVSDEDTIGSRHSSSSGRHSGASDLPSSHSAHSTHSTGQQGFSNYSTLPHNTSQLDDPRQSTSPSLRSSQPLLQTFHPTKPTNHDRSREMVEAQASCNHCSHCQPEPPTTTCDSRSPGNYQTNSLSHSERIYENSRHLLVSRDSPCKKCNHRPESDKEMLCKTRNSSTGSCICSFNKDTHCECSTHTNPPLSPQIDAKSSPQSPAPCYRDVMKHPSYYHINRQEDQSSKPVCKYHHHHHHHPHASNNQQEHKSPAVMARSRSSTSVGRDPMYYAHRDRAPSLNRSRDYGCNCDAPTDHIDCSRRRTCDHQHTPVDIRESPRAHTSTPTGDTERQTIPQAGRS